MGSIQGQVVMHHVREARYYVLTRLTWRSPDPLLVHLNLTQYQYNALSKYIVKSPMKYLLS